VEVGVLQFLNTRGDPDNKHHIVRMRDFFMHRSHLCLVFELLSVNLYELVKHNQFRGLSMNLLRFFILQVRLHACAATCMLVVLLPLVHGYS
jgi:dual specificity protein kinase YAK1